MKIRMTKTGTTHEVQVYPNTTSGYSTYGQKFIKVKHGLNTYYIHMYQEGHQCAVGKYRIQIDGVWHRDGYAYQSQTITVNDQNVGPIPATAINVVLDTALIIGAGGKGGNKGSNYSGSDGTVTVSYSGGGGGGGAHGSFYFIKNKPLQAGDAISVAVGLANGNQSSISVIRGGNTVYNKTALGGNAGNNGGNATSAGDGGGGQRGLGRAATYEINGVETSIAISGLDGANGATGGSGGAGKAIDVGSLIPGYSGLEATLFSGVTTAGNGGNGGSSGGGANGQNGKAHVKVVYEDRVLV